MATHRRLALAGSAVIAALALTACNGYGKEDASKKNVSATESQPAPNGNQQAPAPQYPNGNEQQPNGNQQYPNGNQNQQQSGPFTIAQTSNQKLGTILVADRGNGNTRTFYRFDKDTANPSRSNCDGECLKAWPPVKHTPGMQVQGVDRSLVGNIIRPDGFCQLTIKGWPVYYFAKDVNPGDVNGQGVDGKWFAFAPDGSKAGSGSQQNQNQQNQNQYPNGNQQNQYPNGQNQQNQSEEQNSGY